MDWRAWNFSRMIDSFKMFLSFNCSDLPLLTSRSWHTNCETSQNGSMSTWTSDLSSRLLYLSDHYRLVTKLYSGFRGVQKGSFAPHNPRPLQRSETFVHFHACKRHSLTKHFHASPKPSTIPTIRWSIARAFRAPFRLLPDDAAGIFHSWEIGVRGYDSGWTFRLAFPFCT